MKICMLVEGSYPYITGGVSAWVQMMITAMPEHHFIIYSIAAEEKNRGVFNYPMPANVLNIHEVFLDTLLGLKSPATGRYPLEPDEVENLVSLICGEGDINLELLLKTFRSRASRNPLEIFMSYDFFDVITTAYKKKFRHLPFTDFFWTIRSMLLPLFYLIYDDFPDADIYHSVSTGYAGIIGSLAATIYGKPFVLTEHGIYCREREEEIIKCTWASGEFKTLWINYFNSLAIQTYRKADRVYSLFTQNTELQISLGCPPEKVGIIPNGIDISKYAAIESMPLSDYVTIGAIARVVPVKDIITMIRSFSLVKHAVPNARFIIIGPIDEFPDYYGECQKLITTLGLTDIEFTGAVNIEQYLGRVDILVLSSISEGQPLAVLEGMANRKPYIATDVGSCRQLLEGSADGIGPAGILVSALDFEGMATAITTLAHDPGLREEMGANGYERISRHYTLEMMINGYKAAYDALCKKDCIQEVAVPFSQKHQRHSREAARIAGRLPTEEVAATRTQVPQLAEASRNAKPEVPVLAETQSVRPEAAAHAAAFAAQAEIMAFFEEDSWRITTSRKLRKQTKPQQQHKATAYEQQSRAHCANELSDISELSWTSYWNVTTSRRQRRRK